MHVMHILSIQYVLKYIYILYKGGVLMITARKVHIINTVTAAMLGIM